MIENGIELHRHEQFDPGRQGGVIFLKRRRPDGSIQPVQDCIQQVSSIHDFSVIALSYPHST
jgi:hypothetical protein